MIVNELGEIGYIIMHSMRSQVVILLSTRPRKYDMVYREVSWLNIIYLSNLGDQRMKLEDVLKIVQNVSMNCEDAIL